MKKLGIGTRVRYIGGQKQYHDATLYALIGRTGVIRSKSTVPEMDWFVEMDIGFMDLDAKSKALEPIANSEADDAAKEEFSNHGA